MPHRTTTLHYGHAQVLELQIEADSLLADCTPRGEPVGDVAAETKNALENPLDYPSWSQTVYPGDRVVIAVDPQLPQASAILDAVIDATTAASVSPEDITVLFAAEAPQHETAQLDEASLGLQAARQNWQRASDWASQVKCLLHEPDNRSELAFVATTEEGEPLLVNRALADADVLLPVTVTRSQDALGYCGPHGLLCHTFGDSTTMRRFRAFHAGQSQPQASRWTQRKADEAAWALGLNFCLHVSPGVNGGILEILAGKNDSVAKKSAQAFQSAWRYRLPRSADLVIAAVDSPTTTWLEVAAAVDTAARLVNPDGAIVLLTQLTGPVGRAVQRLAQVESPGEALGSLQTESGEDVVAAVALAHALEQAQVYLVSQLDEDECHDLHFIPVEDPADVQRLVARSQACAVVPSAQLADVRLEHEPADANV
ncbi:MAG: lactate racemase domain-containing protein [Pirellulales bacterium]|nr:lactate racemase domain-containing protein [Pirellulales bacterium]